MIARAIDGILLLVLVEGAALAAYHQRTGKGIPLRPLAANLAAGFGLILAVRLALAQVPEAVIAACLLAAFIAHLFDVATRWRSRG